MRIRVVDAVGATVVAIMPPRSLARHPRGGDGAAGPAGLSSRQGRDPAPNHPRPQAEVPLGEHVLRGIAAPCTVFTLPDA